MLKRNWIYRCGIIALILLENLAMYSYIFRNVGIFKEMSCDFDLKRLELSKLTVIL